MRSDKFRLLIAVCNSPAQRDRIIRDRIIESLQESLPLKISVVRLSESTTDPLSEVLEQLAQDDASAVFVMDLEKAIPSDDTRHLVIQSLNLRRTEWASRVPVPVVFWIPEYLLGLLGREAPDFLDWRSDTLNFPTLSEQAFAPFHEGLWSSTQLSVQNEQRQARIAELRSRIVVNENIHHCTAFLAEWRSKLADELWQDNQLENAMNEYCKAESEYRQINDLEGIGNCLSGMAAIDFVRGDLDSAKKKLDHAVELHQSSNARRELASDYIHLAEIHARQGNLDEAKKLAMKALNIHRSLKRHKLVISDLLTIGDIFQKLGDAAQAEAKFSEALQMSHKLGHKEKIAEVLRRWGAFVIETGDLSKAEDLLNQAVVIDEQLGDKYDLSVDYGLLGYLMTQKGDMSDAIKFFEKGLSFTPEDATRNAASYQWNLALANFKLQRWDEARKRANLAISTNQALSLTEEMGRILQLLVDIEERSGNKEAAADARKRAEVL